MVSNGSFLFTVSALERLLHERHQSLRWTRLWDGLRLTSCRPIGSARFRAGGCTSPVYEGGADWPNQKNVDSRLSCDVADVRSTQQTESSRR